MADDAFALSPIHARAALPTNEDYDAIQEAFMETSRGRWFLTEYAKRNRNADTRMVLDAVERLEAGLASQRAQSEAASAQAAAAQAAAIEAAVAQATAAQTAAIEAATARAAAAQAAAAEAAAAQAAAVQAPAVEAAPKIDIWPELAQAFARTRMEIAQRLVRDSNDEAFETIRASTETLKSISWALRERGFDARICDFLDVQVGKITDGYTGLMAESSVASDSEADILASFDELIQRVEGLTSSDDTELDRLDVVVDAIADAMSEDFASEPMLPEEDEVAIETAAPVQEQAPVVTAEVEAEASPVVAEAAPQATVEAADAAVDTVPHGTTDSDEAFRQIYGYSSDIEIVDVAPPDEPPAPSLPTEPEINKQRLYEAKLEPYRIAETGLQIVAPADDIEIVDVVPVETRSTPVQPAVVVTAPVADTAPVAVVSKPAPVEVQAPVATVEPAKPSLGQALLDRGVIANAASRPDPLAPFRRMSQAEKVAFFT